MKGFLVYWHPEPRSFNAAMFQTACSRKNFTTVKDPNYLKPQIEEMNATEMNGFSEEIESEIRKIEWCELF